jgi:metal-sulfur cluster biosynthetic enzyme
MSSFDNANPLVKSTTKNNASSSISLRKRAERERSAAAAAGSSSSSSSSKRDPIDAREIFAHIKDINDPEHPYSLEQLAVVSPENIVVDDEKSRATVYFTPTVEHCSMATLIGLSIRVQLLRVLPRRFKVDVRLVLIWFRMSSSFSLLLSLSFRSFLAYPHRRKADTRVYMHIPSLSRARVRVKTGKSLQRLARERGAGEQTAPG